MNLCNIRVVKDLMARYGTDTKKGFGQNFLINPAVPENIADESYGYHRERNYGKESAVLEIGPGIGALTCQLCERYDKVVAVEIDRTLIPILDETLAEYDNIKVVNEDFMKLDLKSFIKEN